MSEPATLIAAACIVGLTAIAWFAILREFLRGWQLRKRKCFKAGDTIYITNAVANAPVRVEVVANDKYKSALTPHSKQCELGRANLRQHIINTTGGKHDSNNH